MAEETNLPVELLRRAMGIEQEGRNFYLKAAQATQDKKGQEIFQTLAGDEENHYNLLKSQYDALRENGGWVISPEVKKVNIDLSKPLFPRGIEALKKKVNEKSNDRDALLFGLDIEIRSYDLYRHATVADEAGKRMFAYLAEQEMGHFNLLMQRFEAQFGLVSWLD